MLLAANADIPVWGPPELPGGVPGHHGWREDDGLGYKHLRSDEVNPPEFDLEAGDTVHLHLRWNVPNDWTLQFIEPDPSCDHCGQEIELPAERPIPECPSCGRDTVVADVGREVRGESCETTISFTARIGGTHWLFPRFEPRSVDVYATVEREGGE